MASPRIETTYSSALSQITILENYRNCSLALESKFQHLIAEVIMLRLFSIIENCIRETAQKLACGSSYKNGINPIPIITCRSMSDACLKFQSYNRTKPISLRWTKVQFVNNSIKKIIPPTEPFRIKLVPFNNSYDEMRKVRNHIAHRTSSTYVDYKAVIIQNFGGQLKIKTGAFLTSTKRLSRAKIDTYFSISRIMINDLTNG